MLPIIVGVFFWNKLPNPMATHFNFNNEADGFSSKFFAVVGLPVFMLFVHLISVTVVLKDPKKENISNKVFNLVLWIVPCVSIFVNTFLYTYNLGMETNISMFANIFLGIVFVIMGNYIPKVRQNYSIGITVPWTLANEDNWNKTHRLAGVLWVICGILFILSAFVKIYNVLWTTVVLLAVAVLVPGLYSFMLHVKKDK